MEEIVPYYRNTDLNAYPDEEWFDIKGFEGRYQISTYARIKSLYMHHPNFGYVRRDRIRTSHPNKDTGHLELILTMEWKRYPRKIHLLFAEAFIEKVEGKNIINHEDGNKLNNSKTNLIRCTSGENNQHAYDTGLKKSGEDRKESKLTNKQAVEIYLAKPLTSYGKLAAKYNVDPSTIVQIVKGKTYKNAIRDYLKENSNSILNLEPIK